MHIELMALKTYVALVFIIPATSTDLLIKSTVMECERLKRFMLRAFKNRKNTDHSIQELNKYRGLIIQIANNLSPVSNLDDKVASEMRTIVIELIKHTEEQSGHLLDKHHELPAFIVQELSENITTELQEIEEGLHQKKIPALFVQTLVKAHQDLFKPDRIPKMTYADSQYLSNIMPMLKSFALEAGEKDWPKKLTSLLIKYNFNHMRIYKLLRTEQYKVPMQIKDNEKLNQYFFNQRIWLNEIQVIPSLAFNSSADSLKNLLLTHLQATEMYIKENLEMLQRKKIEKIELSISVDILRLYFYYMCLEGMFNYPFKTEAADAICKHIRTKGTDQVSPRSLLKFDKIALNNSAIKFNLQLQRMQEQLRKDFDL